MYNSQFRFSRITNNFLIEEGICPKKMKEILRNLNNKSRHKKEEKFDIELKTAADVLYLATKEYG